MSARFIPVDPFDLIVFGGTGDLAMRKLLPGLYHRDSDDQLPPESRIIGVSRSETGRKAYGEQVEAAIREHIAGDQLDEQVLARFLRRLDHVALDATGTAGWKKLAASIGRNGKANEVRVFYLATAPRLFGPIARNLAALRAAQKLDQYDQPNLDAISGDSPRARSGASASPQARSQLASIW